SMPDGHDLRAVSQGGRASVGEIVKESLDGGPVSAPGDRFRHLPGVGTGEVILRRLARPVGEHGSHRPPIGGFDQRTLEAAGTGVEQKYQHKSDPKPQRWQNTDDGLMNPLPSTA